MRHSSGNSDASERRSQRERRDDFQWSAWVSSPTYTLFSRSRAGEEGADRIGGRRACTSDYRRARIHGGSSPPFQQCGALISEHRPIVTPREWSTGRVRSSHLIPAAILRITVTNDDATALEQPASVTVDGAFAGVTDAAGLATVHATAGHHVIAGYITGLRSGQAEADASDGVIKAVSVVMHEGIAPRQLQLKVENANGAFLPASSPTFDLSLRDANGTLVPAASIESVEFRTSDDQS